MGMKKKLSKKEKARLEAEQAELLRVEMEKEKQRQLEEERKRKQHEREEAEKRQKLEIIENRKRRAQLKESVAYFEDITRKIDKIKERAKEQNEWKHYMRCNGLPSANNPGDLRKYIHMWCTSALENKACERNWLLKTNERTILTQDKTVPDLTRENLRKSQPNLGDLYSQRIKEVLGVLKEVDVVFNNWKKLSKETVDDLKLLKRKIRMILSDFIDDFTFRILSHVERDMEHSAPGMSEHVYQSAVFETQVWMIQADAPKSNNRDKFKDNSRHIEINFPLLKLQLTLPQTFKLLHSAIRGLWLNYDHFSDYCPSYAMRNIYTRQLNILQQTKKEWKKRKEILQLTLEQATKDTHLQGLDASEEPQHRVIDVDKIYTEYEDELNKCRHKVMGPETMGLTEFDVNLRSHQIVGGLYCIDYLEQPQQDKRLNSSSFIRSIMLPNKLTRKEFYQPYRPPPPPQPGVRRLPEEIEAEMKSIERSLDKLATVTLQLPDTVLWFEPPIVCHWETPEETRQAETELNEKPTASAVESRKSLNGVGSCKRSVPLVSDKPHKIVQDFDMYNIPNTVDIFGIMLDFVVPRLPDGYCVAIESVDCDKDNGIDETVVSVKYLTKTKRSDSLEPGEEGEVEKVVSQVPPPIKIEPLTEKLIETNSSRFLHFELTFNKVLQITQKDDDFRRNSTNPLEKYMFSQMIENKKMSTRTKNNSQDLERLCELQRPYQNDHMVEINSKLSSARSSKSEEIPSRRFSNVIIVRETDSLRKRSHPRIAPPIKTDEDSGSELDEELEGEQFDDSEMNGFDDLSTRDQYYGKWCTRDVHDTKFNEDKLSIQFRTGRLGYFGFAANRYSNMPYQTWELKPDFKSHIIFSLTAAVISLELEISDQGYQVNTFQGGTTESLTEMIGHVYSLEKLKDILARAAINIFPDEDAFCYTEGSCEKNYVMEMHLYACMATLGLSHNFTWSRWNLLSGSRAAVLLMRELQEGKKVPNHSTLYVTPLRASVVECTEVSASFSTTGVSGMEFYADLYHLARDHSLPSSKEKQTDMDPVLRDNIYQIMQAVRPLSFC